MWRGPLAGHLAPGLIWKEQSWKVQVGVSHLCLGRVVAWLVGRLVGTPLMDAWMDGCCVNGEGAAPPRQCKPSLPRTGFLVSTLVGWSVGWHSVDGWLHGWMDGWMGGWILCCLTFRRRPGQFPAVPVVPDSLCAVSGGKKLLR